MQISMKCETFLRLAKVALLTAPDDPRTWLKSVYVESRGGHAWAVATNSKFAAIQYLGVTGAEPGSVLVAVKPQFFPMIELGVHAGAKIILTDTKMLSFCHFFVEGGWTMQENAGIYPTEKTAFETWRNWLPSPDDHTENGRPMFVKGDDLAVLAQSSPSGTIVFPKFIDAEKPVIVRDIANSDWLGVFYAAPSNGVFIEGAKLPDWVRR